ncbi:MAG: cytochrome d ubiquinol oxidase subunit II [Bacteroidia bacterium]|nr:cytochrome d ubiquinol oxidase subunit II [Bacteroidia bacterium]
MDTFLGIDYPTWWFFVVGGLFAGYAVLDGFDFGAGAWHLFFRKESSRRIALNAIGPVWDGNEVWLVIGGGALFAGFPVVYATLFSAMYIPFMLFLAFLILRAVSIEFRSKEPMKWWRQGWDITYSIASITLPILLGIVLGNVLLGFPIRAGEVLSISLLEALNPFAIIVGLTTLFLFMMHGAIYLAMKTDGRLFSKVTILLRRSTIAFIIMFSITTLYTVLYIPHLTDTFKSSPAYFILPLAGILSIANIPRLAKKREYWQAFIFSSLSICLFLLIVAVELYPVILYSTIDEAFSITAQQAASSNKTLRIMLRFSALGFPLVGLYTYFVYRTFRGKVQLDEMSY